MRFGFVMPNNFGIEDPREVIRLGVLAEQLGFDSVWVNHHVLNVGYVKERLGAAPYHDALVMLTWLAAETQTVRLGTSVLVMPYLHPMVLAKELATLDQLSGGRLEVGLGVGSLPEENAALGVPYAGRGAYSNEFIEVLRALWADGPASYRGDHFQFTDLLTSPKPQQRPGVPLMVGGNRPLALRRAARLGDGWHPLGVSPEGLARRLEVLRSEARAAGREQALSAVQVRLDIARVNDASIAEYADAGATELVVSINSSDVAEQDSLLRGLAAQVIPS